MAKKMYYNEDEAASKLGVTVAQLTDFAREGKLQQYKDGAKIVYRADQVDELASNLPLEETGEIELAPADSTAGDAVSLSEAETGTVPGKEDTVITAEGISIFDDEDLEIEAADPMAKTQIAPSLEDQISAEGVGSGSGLLDLTRESDDTSLGPEVLSNIDMESGIGGGLATEEPAEALGPGAEAAVAEMPVVVEAADARAGLFSGFIVGSAILAMLLAIVMISAMTERAFSFVEAMKNNMALLLVGVIIVAAASGVIGLMLGKSVAGRQSASSGDRE